MDPVPSAGSPPRKRAAGAPPPPREPEAPPAPPKPTFTKIPLPAPLPSPLVMTDAPETRGPRLELPSSGLAADILAREEARQVEPAFTAAPAAPVPAAPARGAAAAQSLSFFAVPVQEQRAAAEATEAP